MHDLQHKWIPPRAHGTYLVDQEVGHHELISRAGELELVRRKAANLEAVLDSVLVVHGQTHIKIQQQDLGRAFKASLRAAGLERGL